MKMNYEEMSDFEINKLVAEFRGGYLGRVAGWMKNGVKVKIGTLGYQDNDYCNNASDALPIIVKNKIRLSPSHSINKNKDTWTASDGFALPEAYHLDKNPLRAAMICFLKMKDKETTK